MDIQGTLIFIGNQEFPYRYGIMTGENSVVWMYVNKNISIANGKVVHTELKAFGEGFEIYYSLYQDFDKKEAYERAINNIGKNYPNNYFSLTGDDFINWCITGQNLEQFGNFINSNYFGKHISTSFRDLQIFKGRHHGIGIENDLVVHFFPTDYTFKKAIFSHKGICITHISQFGDSIYIEPSSLNPMTIRNRAINSFFASPFGKYNMLNNNCEHVANWCSNGKHHSTQIQNLSINLTLSAIAALTKPHLAAMTAQKIFKKHIVGLFN